MAAIGSVAYAEDDGRHILGIKVARSPASVRGGGVNHGDSIVCHVLECKSEVGHNYYVYIVCVYIALNFTNSVYPVC